MSDKNIIKFKLPSERRAEEKRRQSETSPPLTHNRRAPQPPGRRHNDVLEAILKSEDDRDVLVQENMKLRRENERHNVPVDEHVLYYSTLGFSVLILVFWTVFAVAFQ